MRRREKSGAYKSAAEREKDAEFKFIADRSAPIAEAILQDEAKPTPEEIAAAFGPTDENCGEGVIGSVVEQADTSGLSPDAVRHGSSTLPAPTEALQALDPGSLTFEVEAIRKKPLTRQTVEEARELDVKLKAYLDQAEKSDVREKVKELFKQHRFWNAMFRKAVAPIEQGREYLSELFAEWERKRIRDAAEQRRKDEAARIAAQQADREADVEHLKTLGHVTEAKELAAAPLPPVALPEPKNAPGKVVGISIIEAYKLGAITGPKQLAEYFVKYPEDFLALMEPKMGEWKRRATAAKGHWIVPGVVFVRDDITRNRG